MSEESTDSSKFSRREFLAKHSRGIVAAAIGAGIAGSMLSDKVPSVSGASVTGNGTAGSIPRWDTPSDIINSNYSDNGTALLASSDNSFDLGTSSQRWRNAYVLAVLSGTSDLVLNPNNAVLPPGNSTRDLGSVSLGWRNVYVGGALNLGTGIGWATFNGHNFGGVGGIQMGGVGTILAPQTDNATDLGTSTQRWRNVNASGTVASAGTSSLSQSTPSRAIGNEYQNTTGKNVFVSIVCSLGIGAEVDLYCNSTPGPNNIVSAFGGGPNAAPSLATVVCMVPPNYYYNARAGIGVVTVVKWTEWTF